MILSSAFSNFLKQKNQKDTAGIAMRNFSIRMKKKAQVRNSLIIATTIE